MKKLLLILALLVGIGWLLHWWLPPALPASRHLAAVPIIRKPDHAGTAHPKRVLLPR